MPDSTEESSENVGESSNVRTALLGRARLSCLPCRKRKSKCDEGAPCSSCVLRGTEEICQLPEKTTPTSQTKNSSVASTSKRQNHANGGSGAEQPALSRGGSTRNGLKRRRVTDQDRTTSPAWGLSEALEEISRLRQGLERLEDFVGGSSSSSTPPTTKPISPSPFQRSERAPDSLPYARVQRRIPPSNPLLVREATRVFPSRIDCEVLLEYLTQETDWLVNCTNAFWLQPIWSRLLHGACVNRAEVAVIAAALAVAALLLAETPHVYYVLSEPASSMHHRLFQYALDLLREESECTPPVEEGERVSLDPMIAFGLALDYTRFSGIRRKEGWNQVKTFIRRRVVEGGLLDPTSWIWETWDEIEKDAARRIIWHLVVDESWISLYSDHRGKYSSHFSPQKSTIAVPRPYWLPARLAGPFGPDPIENIPESVANRDMDMTHAFRPPAKVTARLHRVKAEAESINAAEISEISITLAEWAAKASEYISAIKAWQKESVVMAPYHRDQDREALLLQGVELCDRLKAWRSSIQPVVCEPGSLDATDFHDCRRASQASTVHTGTRQIFNAMLAAWVTQDLVTDVSSPTLIKLQREALNNAKETVRTIGLTKTLLSCGITTYFGCWAAFSFFNAATTLAIPLLGGQKVREEARKSREKLGGLGLTDRYASHVRREDRRSSRGQGKTGHSSAGSTSMMLSGVLSMEDLRSLAPSILQILEFLPMIQVSPLGNEASHRIASLVGAYSIDLPGVGNAVSNAGGITGTGATNPTVTQTPQETFTASTPSSHLPRTSAPTTPAFLQPPDDALTPGPSNYTVNVKDSDATSHPIISSTPATRANMTNQPRASPPSLGTRSMHLPPSPHPQTLHSHSLPQTKPNPSVTDELDLLPSSSPDARTNPTMGIKHESTTAPPPPPPPLQDSRGLAVLDSLVALDDSWWDQLFATDG